MLKEPKIYFFDVGLVNGDEGAKFENLMAISLLKHVYARQDYHAEELTIHYMRTKEKHEVDFALHKDGKIIQIIEAKHADDSISKNLRYFHEKYNYPAVQVVKELKNNFQSKGIEVIRAREFLENLTL